MAQIQRILLGMVAAVWLGNAASAAEEPRVFAVIVGIAEYGDSSIPARPRAEADARALYKVITNKQIVGAAPKDVRLLVGRPNEDLPSEEATRANIVRALEWLTTSARKTDLVLFAWIGQGAPLKGRTECFFASDSTVKDRAKDGITAGDMGMYFDRLASERVCVLLDVTLDEVEDDKLPELNTERMFLEFLSKNRHAAGRMLIAASRGGVNGIDLADHGLFTRIVLDGLRGGADNEGKLADGWITSAELGRYVNQEWPRLAYRHGKSKEQRDSVPYLLDAPPATFDLARHPAAAAEVARRLEQLAALSKKGTVTPEWSREAERLIARVPRLKTERQLREEYLKLLDGQVTLADFQKRRKELLAAAQLPKGASEQFAARVLRAISRTRDKHLFALQNGDLAANAVRGLYHAADEPIPNDIQGRMDQLRRANDREIEALLSEARTRLGGREDLAEHRDIDVAIKYMLNQLDAHSTYIDAASLEQFNREVRKDFTGIGAHIRMDLEREMPVVRTPLKDSPAHKQGLQAGDVILRVTSFEDADGKKLDQPVEKSTKGLPLPQIVRLLQGKQRTTVRLTVERAGSDQPIDIDMVRGPIDVETVLGYRRNKDATWDYWLDAKERIVYIRLTGFSRNTSADLDRVVKRLHKQGIRGLVLDLRFNGGGLLKTGVAVADLFIGDGEIVRIKPRAEREERHHGHREGSFLDFPMVVLVNSQSASASEIVAACLQDHKRAVVIGERTYGKGSVQSVFPFDGGEIKLTTASFWRPNGKNLNRGSTEGRDEDEWGVMPDKVVQLTRRQRDELYEHLQDVEVIQPEKRVPLVPEFSDGQLDAALDYLRERLHANKPFKQAG